MAEIIDLNINIGANTTDFEGSLQKAQNLLKQFESALKKATNVGEINYLNNSIKNLNTTITTLGQQMNKVGRPAGDATNALSNLSRVAQDAPYGFIGIANNLNPLLESFQRLQKETGSSATALQSMVAGLTGPAGIGLALGVVSSLAVTYGKDIAAFFKGPTEKLEKFREELAKLQQDLFKIVGEAQSNRTTGLNLVNLISGGNPTQQQEALKRLKSLYSENAEIKAATIKTDKAWLVHLVNVAAIQEDAAGKEKTTQQVLSAAYAERAKLQAQRNNDLSAVKTEFGGSAQYNQNKADKERATINKQYDALINSLDATIAKAKAKNLELVTTLTNIETPDSKGGKGNTTEKEDPFDKLTKDFESSLRAQETLRSRSLISQQEYLDNVYKIYEDYIKKLAELDTAKATNKIDSLLPKFDIMTFEKNAKSIKDGIDKMLGSYQAPAMEVPKDTAIEDAKKQHDDYLKWLTGNTERKEKLAQDNIDKERKGLEDLQKSYENFAQAIAGTVTNALMAMYDAMQKGQDPLEAIGQMFANIGRQIAAAVIQALIFQALLEAFPALKGVFTAIGGLGGGGGGAAQLLGMASGGIATGPTLAMIGEGSESEAVLPLSKLSGMLNTTFNAGSMSSNGSSGNSSFVLRGQDLLLSVNRAQKASNLKGQNISLA